VCGGQPLCSEVSSFAATITDFRTSTADRNKLLTATVRFQNKKNQPLILGYVDSSGVATDDRGNRYLTNGATVRGIGLIRGNELDAKFTLQPGEASDGRFELIWRSTGREIFGTSFEMELAIREINPIAEGQYTLGREHAIHFRGLGKTTLSQAPPSGGPVTAAQPGTAAAPAGTPVSVEAAAQTVAAAPAPAPAPPPVADACAGKPRCYSAGPFTAEIAQLVSSAQPGQNRLLRLDVKFRNVTPHPIILGYVTRSSTAIDDQGNQYFWGYSGGYDKSSSGIGLVQGNDADPQFALNPGESRGATFQLSRGRDNSVIGTSFTWSATIAQLELLPNGQQVNTVREYSLNFPDLAVGRPSNVQGAAKKLLDIFKKKP